MSIVSIRGFKLFAGSSNLPLAEKIAKNLGIKLGKTDIFRFSNQETRVRIIDNVKGKTCFLLQSLSTPVDQNWVETLFFIDGLKRSGASKIVGIIPWLGYQKQDKQFRSGEAISVAVVIKTLEALGMDTMITFDLHSRLIVSYFKNTPIVLSAFPIFLEEIKNKIGKNYNDFVMVVPDEGAYWQKDFSKKLSIPYVEVAKKRDLQTSKIPFESLSIKGEVKGKTCLIIDDNVYTGSTLIHNAKLLKRNGAKKVYCFVTHAILSGDSPRQIQNSEIDSLTVTDTIFIPKEKLIKKLKIISIADSLGEAIQGSDPS